MSRRSSCLTDRNSIWSFCTGPNEQAVKRVYNLKQRPEQGLNLNVASLEDIYAFSFKYQPQYLEKLYKAFLPGPLTIILQANDRVPAWINSGVETVGFRDS